MLLGGAFASALVAQTQPKDSIKSRIKTWTMPDGLVVADTVPFSLNYINYPMRTPLHEHSIANAYNGVSVSPTQSKIFFDRTSKTDFLFADAYDPYILTSEDVKFYNTTTPWSNISYRSGGTRDRKEENIGFIFTGNFNKRTNGGVTLDYFHGVGEYANQSARRFAGSLFTSYNGRNYAMHASLTYNALRNFENGGLSDLSQLNSTLKPKDMNVNMSGRSSYKYISGYYGHQYSLGIERAIEVAPDSIDYLYVPVTTFAHTLRVEQAEKGYKEQSLQSNFFPNAFLNSAVTNDTANVLNVKNTLSFTMEEEFNKWLRFGLTAYAENEIQRFAFLPFDQDTLPMSEWKSNTKVGGVLSKNMGKYIRYAFGGDIYLLGYKLGEFNLHGRLQGEFQLGKDTVSLSAKAYVRNEEPSYFVQRYSSNHFRWENNFDKTYRTYVGGTLSYRAKYIDTQLSAGVENLTNYIYWGAEGLPAQFNGNIQVLGADLKVNLHAKHFALENNIVYQASSSHYLPLPTLSTYHNLYYKDTWFKVLHLQIGADVRFHTAYYAPILNPALGQFYLQDKVKVGNYPLVNLYANFGLKTVRFYIGYDHINRLFMKGEYLSMPNYALAPANWRLGISWSFYD